MVKDKDAYILSELLRDFEEISKEFGLEEPPVRLKHTYQLKKMLISRLGEEIRICKLSNRDVVYPKSVDQFSYSQATLKGHGLCDDDIAKAFSNLVRRKLANRDDLKWSPTPEQFLSSLKSTAPLPCIYNAIVWSVNPRREVNQNGYVETNIEQAEKIASITQCWEGLINRKRMPTTTALSLTLHRVTGSKEATILLHKCGMGISYHDVRLLTNSWTNSISTNFKNMLKRKFKDQKSVHITFDNSDGKQQTLTGSHTTHHTTGTIFQTGCENKIVEDWKVSESDEGEQVYEEFPDYGNYKIPKKKISVPSFPEYDDKYANSYLLDISLQRDIAWAVVNAIGIDCLLASKPDIKIDEVSPVGSWTAFMKDTSGVQTNKCTLEYLPVVPLPPSDKTLSNGTWA